MPPSCCAPREGQHNGLLAGQGCLSVGGEGVWGMCTQHCAVCLSLPARVDVCKSSWWDGSQAGCQPALPPHLPLLRLYPFAQPYRSVYELYCDYVLKNPFHEMDQVIKSELFDQNLLALLAAVNRRWGVGLPQ